MSGCGCELASERATLPRCGVRVDVPKFVQGEAFKIAPLVVPTEALDVRVQFDVEVDYVGDEPFTVRPGRCVMFDANFSNGVPAGAFMYVVSYRDEIGWHTAQWGKAKSLAS